MEELSIDTLSMGQMAKAYNALSGATAIKHFKDRPTAVRRVELLTIDKNITVAAVFEAAGVDQKTDAKAAPRPRKGRPAKEAASAAGGTQAGAEAAPEANGARFVDLELVVAKRGNSYRLFAVGHRATGKGGVSKTKCRITIPDQPKGGFKTVVEAGDWGRERYPNSADFAGRVNLMATNGTSLNHPQHRDWYKAQVANAIHLG